MKNNYIVYKHIAPNGKIYIGQTCQTTSKRYRHGAGYKNCTHFYAAIQKYEWDNFEHCVISEGLTKAEADWIEVYLISYYNSNNPDKGYNLAKGGRTCAGVKRSEEFKKHLSEINKGKVLSPEHRRKISEGNKGKKLSDAQKKLLSEINKGKVLSKEHIEKLRLTAKTRIRTAEEIEKSVSKRRGIPLSDETKRKLSESHMGQHPWNEKEVECIETGERYFSAREAGRRLKLNSNNISFCCRGIRNTCGGYHWRYTEHNSKPKIAYKQEESVMNP